MRCAEVKEMIPALAHESEPSFAVRRHIGKCHGCQQELEDLQEPRRRRRRHSSPAPPSRLLVWPPS